MAKKKVMKKTKSKVKKEDFSNMDLREIPLGYHVRDKVTGFEGIAIAKVVFMNGCVQYHIKPRTLDKESKMKEASSFDFQQLEVISRGIAPKEKIVKSLPKPPGGIMPDAPKII